MENKLYLVIQQDHAFYENEDDEVSLVGVFNDNEKLCYFYKDKLNDHQLVIIDSNNMNVELKVNLSKSYIKQQGIECHDLDKYVKNYFNPHSVKKNK